MRRDESKLSLEKMSKISGRPSPHQFRVKKATYDLKGIYVPTQIQGLTPLGKKNS